MARSRECAVTLVVIATLATTPHAQDEFQFRYHPPPGYRLNTVHDVTGTLLLRGFPGTERGQEVRFESIVGATDVSRGYVGADVLVETTFDSVRARYESLDGQSWVDFPIPYRPAGVMQRLRDASFRSIPHRLPEDPFFLNAARGLRMMVEIPVPLAPTGVGMSWPVEFAFPFTSQIPSDSALLITVDLVARGTAHLDSLVERSVDTLAFVSVTAAFDPVTLRGAYSHAAGDLAVTMTGSLVGSHVWSTGWFGWAGSYVTVTVDHRVSGFADALMSTTVVSGTRVGA